MTLPLQARSGAVLDDKAQRADLNIAAGQTEAERVDKGLGWPVTGAIADRDVGVQRGGAVLVF
jgi:hypothetical protein